MKPKAVRLFFNPFLCWALAIAALIYLGMTTGCATTSGVASPSSAASAPKATFDDRLHQAYQEVTVARRASTKLALAGKITPDEDQQYQEALSAIKNTLDQAQGKSLSDPAQAADLLAKALQQFAIYQGAKQ